MKDRKGRKGLTEREPSPLLLMKARRKGKKEKGAKPETVTRNPSHGVDSQPNPCIPTDDIHDEEAWTNANGEEQDPRPDEPIREPQQQEGDQSDFLPEATLVVAGGAPNNNNNNNNSIPLTGDTVAVATKSTGWFDWRSKRVRLFLALAVLVVLGAIAGVVAAIVSTNNNSDSSSAQQPHTPETTASPTTSPPTVSTNSPAPTTIVLQETAELLLEEEDSTSFTGPRGERYFGWAVDISSDGQRLALSAPYCPCVFIYDEQQDGTWSRTGTISVESELIVDHISLSGDGSTLALGTPISDAAFEDGGKIQVFTEISGTWQSVGNSLFGQAPFDRIGGFVEEYGLRTEEAFAGDFNLGRQSFDTRTIAMSTNGRVLAIGSSRGNYVRAMQFDMASSSWTTLGNVDFLVGEEALDEFGTSVDLSGDGMRLVVGAPNHVGAGMSWGGIRTGQVRAFQYDSTLNQWISLGQPLVGDLPTDGDFIGEQAGSSVSMSDDGLVIAFGATIHDDYDHIYQLGGNDGYAKVFRYDEDRDLWVRRGNRVNVFQLGLEPEEVNSNLEVLDYLWLADRFPVVTRLSGNGNRLAVSVMAESLGLNPLGARGVVRLYEQQGERWALVGEPVEGSEVVDHSGRSLALSSDGDRLIIGAPEHNGKGGDQGQVRVFDVQGVTATPSPSASPTVTPAPTPTIVPITLVSASEREGSWTLHCGGIELLSISAANFTQTLFVGDGDLCRMTSEAFFNAPYKLYYGEDTSNEDMLIANSSWYTSEDFQDQVYFRASPNTASIVVDISFDNFDFETGWSLECDNVTYVSNPNGHFRFVPPIIGIRAGATCEFTITDVFGDGMTAGQVGSYKIFYGDDPTEEANTLVSGSGAFGSKAQVSFTVAPPTKGAITTVPVPAFPVLTAPPMSPPTRPPSTSVSPTVSAAPHGPLVAVSVVILFGESSFQIGWRLECNGATASSFPPGTFFAAANMIVEETVQVEDEAPCNFIISDATRAGRFPYLGDEVSGPASYKIFYGDDTSDSGTLLVAGGQFDYLSIVSFTVSPFAIPDTPSPTAQGPTSTPTTTPEPSLFFAPEPLQAPATLSPTTTAVPTREGAVPITIAIQFDNFPSETGWRLICNDNEIENIPDGTYSLFSKVQETVFVDDGAPCQLTITDSFGDGFCCNSGDGSFQVFYGKTTNGVLLLSGSGKFGRELRVTFTASTDP